MILSQAMSDHQLNIDASALANRMTPEKSAHIQKGETCQQIKFSRPNLHYQINVHSQTLAFRVSR